MRVPTLMELLKMTRIELCELMSQIVKILPKLPIGLMERNNAITNLRNICNILAKGELTRV